MKFILVIYGQFVTKRRLKKFTLGINEIGNTSKNIKLANYNLIVDGSPFNGGDVKLTTRRALPKREAS